MDIAELIEIIKNPEICVIQKIKAYNTYRASVAFPDNRTLFGVLLRRDKLLFHHIREGSITIDEVGLSFAIDKNGSPDNVIHFLDYVDPNIKTHDGRSNTMRIVLRALQDVNESGWNDVVRKAYAVGGKLEGGQSSLFREMVKSNVSLLRVMLELEDVPNVSSLKEYASQFDNESLKVIESFYPSDKGVPE